MPRVPPPVIPGVDPGWTLGLNMAHIQRLAHGKDIVWTYGPLGYLNFADTAGGSMYPVLTYRLSVFVIWLLVMVRLALVIEPATRALWVVFTLGIAAVLDPSAANDHLELAVLSLVLAVLVDTSRWRGAELILLALLTGLTTMMKISVGMQSVAVFVGVGVAIALRERPLSARTRRDLAISAMVFAGSVMIFYFAGTGDLRSLLAYLRGAWDISAGYSEAMALPGPFRQALVALLSMAVLFLILPMVERPVSAVFPAFIPAVFSAMVLFKGAMVRQDVGHATSFEIRLAAVALFFVVTARWQSYRRSIMAFQAVLFLLGYWSVSESLPDFSYALQARLELRESVRLAASFLHWRSTWKRLEDVTSTTVSVLRASPTLRLAVGGGSVEAMPWDVVYVNVNGWRWRPRPVFQSYSAYTPRLDRLNAEHLEGNRAADFILQRWDAIDQRHLFLEAPLSWRAQLDRYDAELIDQDILLLRRRSRPRFERLEALGSQTVGWHQEISVPQDPNPVLVSAHIGKSLYGSIRAALYRSNAIWVEFTHRSGLKTRYRGLRQTFADGVLINQLPEDLGDLLLLGRSGCTPSDPVVSFNIATSGAMEFRRDIVLEWSRLIPGAPPLVYPQPTCLHVGSPNPSSFPAWGGTGTLSVVAGLGVPWSLHADAPWIRLTSNPAGSGKGTVRYAIVANTSPTRRTAGISTDGITAVISQLAPPGNEPTNAIPLAFFRCCEQPQPLPEIPRIPGFEVVVDVLDGFGLPGDQPVAGAWTGDGVVRVGVFRNGAWYLDLNGNRKWDGVDGGDGVYQFGQPGDIAVVGDWNGTGTSKFGVFRHGLWVLDVNGNRSFDQSDPTFHFGLPSDLPIVGKWKHSGTADQIGVYRNGLWIVDSNGDGTYRSTDMRFSFGLPGDMPVTSYTKSHIGVLRNGVLILDTNSNNHYDSNDLTISLDARAGRFYLGEW